MPIWLDRARDMQVGLVASWLPDGEVTVHKRAAALLRAALLVTPPRDPHVHDPHPSHPVLSPSYAPPPTFVPEPSPFLPSLPRPQGRFRTAPLVPPPPPPPLSSLVGTFPHCPVRHCPRHAAGDAAPPPGRAASARPPAGPRGRGAHAVTAEGSDGSGCRWRWGRGGRGSGGDREPQPCVGARQDSDRAGRDARRSSGACVWGGWGE